MPSAPARVLSNLPLPAPPGTALRAFRDYLPPGPAPAASHPERDRRALRDILPLIPASERPDALLLASPEYLPIPPDLPAFTGMKILLITDWNVCLRFLPDLCPLFDFCFTDWPGYRLLRRIGIPNVFHQALFGHDPAAFRDLALPRNLDVSFCGNLNAGLHGERNRMLARVARWAGPRPVHLRQAFGRDYAEVLNRSRLVFNWSIRGEANMRVFEAMACGAAPLVEASNQEVPILFQEGRHYFRYEPGRLEARLDELLGDSARIAAVGEAARAEVARHTKAAQIGALLATAGREAPGRRPAARGSADGAKAAAKLRMLGSSYTLAEAIAAIRSLEEALPGLEEETLPGALLTLIEGEAGSLPSAEGLLERLLSGGRQPHAVEAFLRMRLEARRGRWHAVLSHAETCLLALDALRAAPAPGGPAEGSDRLRGLYARYYPPIHLGKGFNSDINRAFALDAASGGWEGFARLLQAHCRASQARAHSALGRPDAALACAEAIPVDGYASLNARSARAQVAEAAGDAPRARREWEAACAESPLDAAAWDKLADALMRAGDKPALVAFLEDVVILARCFLPEDQARQAQARLAQERGSG